MGLITYSVCLLKEFMFSSISEISYAYIEGKSWLILNNKFKK